MDERLLPYLRALPYALRGASTPEFHFNLTDEVEVSDDLPQMLSTLLQPLIEPCLLYRAIDRRMKLGAPQSLLSQALYSGIRENLRSYLSLIGEIEVLSLQRDFTLAKAQNLLISPCVYLRLFYKLLLQCSESNENLLGVLWEYTQHGEPLVAEYAHELFTSCNQAFQRIKTHWENMGSLEKDLFREFYVRDLGSDRSSGASMFQVVPSKVPHGIMTSQDVQNSLDRGSAIYFIRQVCGDVDYNGSGKSSADIMAHAHRLLFTENRLMLHFEGLKTYMFLTNCDFVDALFRNDTTNFLVQPVSNVGTHLASDFFLGAIDDISQHQGIDEQVSKALDAKILGIEGRAHNQQQQRRRVWEAFVGKYHLDAAPLRHIIDNNAIKLYERCFVSLWRLRLAAHNLDESSALLRRLERTPGNIDTDLVIIREILMLMYGHVSELQQRYYYGIIETEWLDFTSTLSKQRSMSVSLIKQCHDRYLAKVVSAAAEPDQLRHFEMLSRCSLNFQYLLVDLVEKMVSVDSLRPELMELQSQLEENIYRSEVV